MSLSFVKLDGVAVNVLGDSATDGISEEVLGELSIDSSALCSPFTDLSATEDGKKSSSVFTIPQYMRCWQTVPLHKWRLCSILAFMTFLCRALKSQIARRR
ncbi:hypothetical protein WA026_015130 [Henosepilachna vigintioctopunctata]|uniref:Uncharacterized protein n=1 Tax=Henosepilachna vigintioctopunctata TaxID=420089 RepID=A0AAW1TUR8_9CUCU